MSLRSASFALVIGLTITSTAFSEEGITGDKILLGQSCALKGPAKALGLGMQTGLQVYFDGVNKDGGIHGRTIELKTINDGYEPDKCVKATTMLIDKMKVFALIGGVGTPTAKVAVPICEENEVPFIAPFTGAEFLRNPYKEWVVNFRGSYYQEMERLTQYLVDGQGYKKIACFYQNDGYGKAGLSGIELALKQRGLELCATGTYERNTVAVAGGLDSIAPQEPDAIVMVGAYKACSAFITAAKSNPATADATYCNISFVGTKALINELGAAGEGCVVSQVVPYPWDTSIPVVAEYQKAMKAAGKKSEIGFVSLEGYLSGKFFCTVMENIEGEPTREQFIAKTNEIGTFELGGVTLVFGSDDHQGMDDVFLTIFKGGDPVVLDGARVAGVGDAR